MEIVVDAEINADPWKWRSMLKIGIDSQEYHHAWEAVVDAESYSNFEHDIESR